MPDPNPSHQRLIEAALQTVREVGIAGVSARTVAATGGFSQGLIFYHFDTVENLLVAASEAGSAERVAQWSGPLAQVQTLADLVALAERLHEAELDQGNVTVLAQFLAGSQTHPALAAATGAALDRWVAELKPVVARVLGTTPLADVIDTDAVASLVADAFVGIELAASTRDEEALAARFAAMRQLAAVIGTLNDLGPVANAAIRRTLRKA